MSDQRSIRTSSRRAVITGIGGTAGAGLLTWTAGRWSWAAAQQATPVPLQHDFSVSYRDGGGLDTQLDVFWPNHRHRRPALALIHGGGLFSGGRFQDGFDQMAQTIARAGYVTFNIDYRLFSLSDGSNPWPAQLDDVQLAVRWIRANAVKYGVDPARIGALGHSSGGQLAAFLGTRDTRDNSDAALASFSSRVSCVVDLSGNVDATLPLSIADFNAARAAVLGGTASNPPSAAAYADFSPITFVDPSSSPFLILHGASDSIVPIENASRMAAKLTDAGVEVDFETIPGDHLDTLDWSAVGPTILGFLDRELHPEA